jgi:signal transduction histidine kinase/ActR/RegA family two-component response regulator
LSDETGHVKLKRTIFARSGGLMVILALGIFVASTVFVIGEQRDDERQQALGMARFLATQASQLDLWKNPEDLTSYLNQIKRFHFSFEYVVVTRGGNVVFHSFPGHQSSEWLNHDPKSEAGRVKPHRRGDGTTVYDAAVSILTSDAVVHVGVLRGPVEEHTATTLRSIAAGSVLALLLGLGLAWMVARMTTREVAVAEMALRESEERYRYLFEHSPDSILLMNLTGDGPPVIIDCNEATCQMHGYSKEEMIDFPVEVVARMVEIGGESVLQGIDRDISDRKRAEEEKRSLEAQLVQAQKMDAIGRLAGGIAHDINNVLGTVMGATSLLTDELGPDHPQSPTVETIALACSRGRDVTRNFLGYARKGTFIKEVLHPNTLIEETAKLLEATIPKKIKIDCRLNTDLWPVTGDRSLIAQALMNVCLNAVDAMEGEGTLRIESDNTELNGNQPPIPRNLDPGRYVRLTVRDSGVGMDQETASNVFEPFFTTKAKGKGTGLGLSMVYGTILSHGGAVTLESVPGDGTSVFLLLPATDAAPDAPADLAVSTEETQDVGGLVLLVEDESLLRHVGRKMLEKLGFSVVEAENGVSGVEAFKEHGSEIALVILDLVMPEMDGAEAFAELKKIDPDVAVLISSGFTDDEVVEELLANGAVGFVEKPFDLNSLREAVAAALSGRPSSPH